MAKGCPEEFNPWPPFVDIFASVILVLMLFLLITVVNIGYYAQFKSKMSYTATASEKPPELSDEDGNPVTLCKPTPKVKVQARDENDDKISFRKMAKPTSESSKNSMFSGGLSEGNAVSYIKDKNQKVYDNQKAKVKQRSIEILFKDKEIFISTPIKHQIRKFIGTINRITTKSTFTIYVADPSGIISATLAKQISLGRILNIKSVIKKTNIKAKRIKMNLYEDVSEPSKYGSLVIKANLP